MTTLSDLRQVSLTALAGALGGARRVGLVNFPNHGNPGDPAIWLGTRSLLRELGVAIDYSAAWWNFDPALASRTLKGAPVLLNGGGNFGDLYEGQQRTREHVLQTMLHNPVIQMPQSIHFRDSARLDEVREMIVAHGNVTLMTREHTSAGIVREAFGLEPIMSPDHALALAPRPRPIEAHMDIVWIGRQPGDVEYLDSAAPPSEAEVASYEWMAGIWEDQAAWDPKGLSALQENSRLFARHGERGGLKPREHRRAARTFEPLAVRWVEHGMRVLASGRVVVTDKLHGHIFCLLMGIPQVVLDNSYGKVSATLDAWTADLLGVHRASNGAEAWQIANRLLEAAT